MVRKSRVVAILVALLMLLGTTLSLVGTSPAEAAPASSSHNDTRAVTEEPVELDFPIEYLGVIADLAPGATEPDAHGVAPYGEARFLMDGAWTAWQPFNQEGAQGTGQFTSSLLLVDHAQAYQVRGLPDWGVNWRAAAISTSGGSIGGVPQPGAGARVASADYIDAPGCRSRADWGADESIRWWKAGDPQSYHPVQTLTVHHTAGSNSPTQDYAATVRAIYKYHVESNGWSDIGYQYLIDGNGIVYEGRNSGKTSQSGFYGGDGSDFGYQSGTDRIITGAHVGGYNSGNVGISLMGCFEPGTCTGDTNPPAAAVDSLATLLGRLAARHDLDPTGATRYVNPVGGASLQVNVVSAHRNWNSTSCPGELLYGMLPQIRQLAWQRMQPYVFADVPPGTQFYDEINWLYEQGIATGWVASNGTRNYQPLSSINRDAMAAFIYRYAGSPAYTPLATSPFTDIGPGEEFYTEISWMYEMGYATGWQEPDGSRTYRPLTSINRDAMAAFLYRYAGSPNYTLPVGSPFTDIGPADNFFLEVSWLAGQGISTGWVASDGTASFKPVQPVARDAMAAFLYRFDQTIG